MINYISIKNFALIEDAEADFQKGLNVITGETGSGKSVLFEAISLALGARADKTYVRTGCDKAVIQMTADYRNRDYVITREVSSAGKNLCKINGDVVTLAELKDFCSKIADIHGQYDNQSLLNVEGHLALVDKYEKNATDSAKDHISDLYERYRDACKKYEEAAAQEEEIERRKEFISYEINEIEMAQLMPAEDIRLEEDIKEMTNAEKIYEAFTESYREAFEDDNSILDGLDRVQRSLHDIAHISKEAARLEDEFSDLYYRVEDVSSSLRDAKYNVTFSEQEIEDMRDRLDLINQLKRKYGDTIEGILDYADERKKELYKLENTETDSLRLERDSLREMLEDETNRLTMIRKSAAADLQGKIQAELEHLNFKDAEVLINFNELPDFTPNGKDKVEFMISTNKGEPVKPLAKIASGGEMSRIMLAFKKIIGEYDEIPTMIFDEIDTGISGEAASIVGHEMLEMAERHQIITITHLPQIAACADHNFSIVKHTDEEHTYTEIRHLNDDEKIAEIAKLLSGISVSDITIKNAKEMIGLAR
ncbi:MAG: DNA repair protein RecN [Anaerovoracaceae bacterium]|nr:DNA repair protein RecN [Anaerovoracaceae bacterium]